jgi:formate dehydrogenase subunit gamma
VPVSVRFTKGPLRWLGNIGMLAGVLIAGVHYVRVGRKQSTAAQEAERGASPGADRASPIADRPSPIARLLRYAFAERVTHAVAALSYLYLALTGLALWTPALFWLAIALGGGFLSRLLHPWVGVVFSVGVGWMYTKWRSDMRTTDADRAWRRSIAAYVRNEDDRVPPAGRFNYGQKQLFWVMVWGALALLVTGLVLWVPETMPLALRQLAMAVHAIASIVTIAALIVHVYMGIAVVPGSMDAIVHGEVTTAWARQHHPLWADEVLGVRRGPDPSGAPPSDAAVPR